MSRPLSLERTAPIAGLVARASQDGARAVSATHYLLNVLHAVQCTHPATQSRPYPLGAAINRRHVGDKAGAPFTPPSVAATLASLTASPGFEAGLPFVRFTRPDNPMAIVAEALVDGAVPNVEPPPAIPVSGARHECFQLRWNRPGVPLCAAGPECEAARVPGAPGPLPVYRTPSEEADGVDPGEGSFCLLCIRADARALADTLGAIVKASASGLGGAAIALPPFQNLVNCADGYKESVLGVTPAQSFVFTPISIVGPLDLRAEYDEAVMGGFYVDQHDALWGTQPTPLNGGALESTPAPGSSACSPPSFRPGPMTKT